MSQQTLPQTAPPVPVNLYLGSISFCLAAAYGRTMGLIVVAADMEDQLEIIFWFAFSVFAFSILAFASLALAVSTFTGTAKAWAHSVCYITAVATLTSLPFYLVAISS